MRIIIPAGTYFKNRGRAQDMVATGKVTIDLLKTVEFANKLKR
ncbi:MAG: hypothetical protein QXT84_04125 [Candidatus Bathyarchaeia archaeon]